MTRRRRRGKAHRLAAARSAKYYDRQVYYRRTPGFWDDWRFIWSSRTHHGQRRSWIQRLLRW